jgi:hypothetical protein
MFEKLWANIIRYYTSKVRLCGLTKNQDFEPSSLGFASVAASNKLDFSNILLDFGEG